MDLGGLKEQEIVQKCQFSREGGMWPMGRIFLAGKGRGERQMIQYGSSILFAI